MKAPPRRVELPQKENYGENAEARKGHYLIGYSLKPSCL